MKKYFFCLFVFTSLVGFAQQNAFYGHWLLRGYVEALLSTRSPYKIQGKFDAMTELVIVPSLKDSVMVNFDEVEGATYPMKITSSKTAYFTKDFDNQRFDMQLKTIYDTISTIVLTDKNGVSREYLYFKGDEKAFTGVKNLMNEVLFAGTYQKLIEMNVRTRGMENVKLYTNGKIEGVENADKYEVLTCFDDISDFDVMKLIDSRTQKFVWKGWEIKGKKLILYNLTKGEVYNFQKSDIFLELDLDKQVKK